MEVDTRPKTTQLFVGRRIFNNIMDWLWVLKRKEGSDEQDHEHLLITDEFGNAKEGHEDQTVGQDVQNLWVDGLLAAALPLTFFFFACSIVLYWQAKHMLAIDSRCTKRMSGYCQSILSNVVLKLTSLMSSDD